jgi:hypothetical protein
MAPTHKHTQTHTNTTTTTTNNPQHKQLTKRYEAIVRVCQWQAGESQRARNVGGILDAEKAIKAALAEEGKAAGATA